eukprot:gnl/TRDRNA2_/TRDRNA2_172611_c1_seq6.p1 gnl/TRDRNA2_/TRDRNA2_172611_c1~~gnl/TRDRNA2_/TRDRNA2_172611_c1_seq6.p1  ORF type:complete len:177 (-),score=29.15 gnl/TRDRNA2_/TRDRNA2_172611_c1_seq6:8-538(-)
MSQRERPLLLEVKDEGAADDQIMCMCSARSCAEQTAGAPPRLEQLRRYWIRLFGSPGAKCLHKHKRQEAPLIETWRCLHRYGSEQEYAAAYEREKKARDEEMRSFSRKGRQVEEMREQLEIKLGIRSANLVVVDPQQRPNTPSIDVSCGWKKLLVQKRGHVIARKRYVTDTVGRYV